MGDIFEIIGLKGSRIILRELSRKGNMRYSELQEVVGSPSTTNLALQKLKDGSLVKRTVLDEPYRPVAYNLTDFGKKVAALLVELESASSIVKKDK
jgi:DNA-binding HxlR family transcriptional regulator